MLKVMLINVSNRSLVVLTFHSHPHLTTTPMTDGKHHVSIDICGYVDAGNLQPPLVVSSSSSGASSIVRYRS